MNPSQFKKWFSVLTVAFNKKVDKETKDAWYAEVKKCDFATFKRTIEKLKYIEWFPSFKDFWNFYRQAEKAPVVADCGNCYHGMIYTYKPKEREVGLLYEYAAPCKVCHPERSGAVDPLGSFNYAEWTEPWKYRHTINLPRSVNLGLLQELVDKMDTKGVDWEKETEEAWARHEAAVKGGMER